MLMEDRCQVLSEYMEFVDCVRDFYRKSDYNNLKDAISRAKGLAEGRVEGQANLQNVFLRMVEGASEEELSADGYSKEEINRAKEMLRKAKGN